MYTRTYVVLFCCRAKVALGPLGGERTLPDQPLGLARPLAPPQVLCFEGRGLLGPVERAHGVYGGRLVPLGPLGDPGREEPGVAGVSGQGFARLGCRGPCRCPLRGRALAGHLCAVLARPVG
eukprot:4657038-Lingulodinium_polyedra.AAC.1